MLRVVVFLACLVQGFGEPLLVWSQSGLGSLASIPLGAKLTEGEFQSDFLAPVCSDHKVVLLEAPNVTRKELYQIGGNDENQWKSMKSLLSKAESEKVVELTSDAGHLISHYENSCDFERFHLLHDAQEEAAVVVDEKINQEVEKQIAAENSKPIVYILRLLNGQQEENLVRRSADAIPAESQMASTDSGFVSTTCHRFYFDRIEFQPLRPLFKDKEPKKPEKRFVVNGWSDAGSKCDATSMKKDKTMTIKMKGTKPENTRFTEINVEFVVKAYGLYGTSGKSYKYWYTQSMTLSYKYDGGDTQTARISPGYMAAPQGYSYACQKPDNQPLAAAAANLLFTNLQFDVNMFIDGTQPKQDSTFNDGVDCEARLGQGGIVGLFFVIIVLLTTLYIIAMLSSAKNPVFGDKQIVVNQE